jgi:hypothetical protein
MSAHRTWFLSRFVTELSERGQLVLSSAACVPLYLLYIAGLTENPPGFYVDESAVSYNALTIYLWGQGDSGHPWPLFFPVYPYAPDRYLGYADPVQIYLLAALYSVFPPSVFLSRALEATAMFLASMLLGFLAKRISNSRLIGIIVALTAMLTPWLFEIGRIAFAAGLYPLMVVLLLLALYSAYRKDRWSLIHSVLIALALALTTYTYAIGRLLGPFLAFGLTLFATDLKRLKNVLITWLAYGITLLPLLVFHLRHPGALTGRYKMTVGYITREMGYGEILSEFISHYSRNLSLENILFIGDPIIRHHVSKAAPILAGTFFLAVIGVLLIAAKYRSDPWWRFVVYGLFVSVIPASLTIDEFHSLRLAAFPVFLIVLTVPALMWLLADARKKVGAGRSWRDLFVSKRARYMALTMVLTVTVFQAVLFQIHFWDVGPNRGDFFDSSFPAVFAAAMEQPKRPIYLIDENYYHTFWQAAIQGIDTSDLVRLEPGERPPPNSIVLSDERACRTCDIIVQHYPFGVYETPPDSGQPRGFENDQDLDDGNNRQILDTDDTR